jgi:hypothetical protein
VEADRGLDVGQRLLVAVALAYDDALEPEGVGDVAVGVLLDDNT